MKEKQAGSLKFAEVLESLDREIQALSTARALLQGGEADAPVKRGRGRPRKIHPPSEGKTSGQAGAGRKRSSKAE